MDVSLCSMVVAVVVVVVLWYVADGLLQLFLIMLNKLPNTIIYIEGHRIILHHSRTKEINHRVKTFIKSFQAFNINF